MDIIFIPKTMKNNASSGSEKNKDSKSSANIYKDIDNFKSEIKSKYKNEIKLVFKFDILNLRK